MSKEFLKGNFAEAIDIWNENLSSRPNDITIICNIATAYYKMEMYRKCSTECNKVIERNKSYSHAYILKGLSFVKRNKISDAVKTWENGINNTDNILFIQEFNSLIKNPRKEDKETIENENTTVTLIEGEKEETLFTISNKGPKISENEFNKLKEASEVLINKGKSSSGGNNLNFDAEKQIAFGFLQVNTGKFDDAIKTFQYIINTSSPVPLAAYLGRGTAYALANKLELAIKDFSSAINNFPNYDDAWKRRAQARAAQGNIVDAICDMDRAIQLKADPDSYFQRGIILYRQKNYNRASADFLKTMELNPKHGQAYVQYGLCKLSLGYPWDAITYFDKSFEYEPVNQQTLVYKGQAYKEWGNYEDSFATYSKGLKLEPFNSNCLYMRGMSSFSVGKHHLAIKDFTKALQIQPTLLDCRKMNAVANHGIGKIRKAIEEYNICLQLQPGHISWYNKEIALYLAHHLDDPITSFHLDKDLNPFMKEAWCKRLDPRTLPAHYIPQKPLPSSFKDVEQIEKFKPSSDLEKIIEKSKIFGPQIQLNCVGYCKNLRQWRMCGFAVIDFAQQLKEFWKACKENKEDKSLDWRHFYDIIVHWRQYSEPNDPVVWVDLLTPEQFEEGFGSHTPIITGQTWVVRYSPMFEKSFPIFKEEIKQTGISSAKQEEFSKINTLEEAYDIMNRDFWICTPCKSTKYPTKIYEGTRLTLQRVHPEGFEYSIRTPGTPSRWKQYTEEMEYIFTLLKNAIIKEKQDLDEISNLILTLTFYWYNFMPLARGTAACGYIGLLGMFLSIDYEIKASIPEKQQVDWEGILNPHPDIFISKLKPWMYPARTKSTILDDLPSVANTLNTLRKRIEALNCEF